MYVLRKKREGTQKRRENTMEKSTLLNVIDIKIAHPNVNTFRTIRYRNESDYRKLLEEINCNQYLSELMKEEYFPKTLETMCNIEMNYVSTADSSIKQLLVWGSYLLRNYADEINKYLKYKECYESRLFNGEYKLALKWVKKIEEEIAISLWGQQQVFFLLNVQNEADIIDAILNNADKYSSSNMAPLLMYFYSKMTNRQVTYNQYRDMVNNILSGADSTNAAWKYLDYKLSIEKEKNIHGIKLALALDEQISIIDYYETYIDSLILLSGNEKKRDLITDVLERVYSEIDDHRLKCIYTAYFDPKDVIVDEDILEIIEEYTCGNYEKLEEIWKQKKEKIVSDYVICNIFVKAHVDISKNTYFLSEFWKEIQKIYGMNYEKNLSIQKICEYYKILYNTSWRYKLQGVLARKLNMDFGENVLNYSILNDKYFTPIFHQCISRKENKIKYINKFATSIPATYQLQQYLITGKANSPSLDLVENNRRVYYEIKYCFEQEKYEKCIATIECVRKSNKLSVYEEERIDRILFSCYLETQNYVDAMQEYVKAFLFNEMRIARMNIALLVKAIEETDDEQIKANICRSIILSMFYEGKSDEIISSYLDYLEFNGCNTIIDYLDKNSVLDEYQVIFLDKVCTTKLLLKDYISKTITNGSAVELRVQILKKLIANSIDNQKFVSELNTIYKEQQLKTRIDSFNHNRIFIDRDNLMAHLKEEITKEFARYNAVQEIRLLTKGAKVGFANKELLMEIYWDETKFFTEIVEKIKAAYLSESPYSLESFLSTRIRHNFCNDKLKNVFEEQTLFSKKETDASHEYNVNTYWQEKMSPEEYKLLRPVLSQFSREIDSKIQQIKADWIRIKKSGHKEGMFDYLDFTYYFMNYVPIDFDIMIRNPMEYVRAVVETLDLYTDNNLASIRKRIYEELRPYYYDKLLALESRIKELDIAQNNRGELLRRIETSKAKYIEDIDSFQDIFNMDNEKYLDYGFDELIEFCVKIESDMNRDFSNAQVSIDNRCNKNYKGSTFPYLVDILGILMRNAVQHSQIKEMRSLNITIKIEKLIEADIPDRLWEIVKDYINKENFIVINICNNLDESVDEDENFQKMLDIINNISNKTYKIHSNREGGSGFYKIARTVDYNLGTSAFIYSNRKKGYFDVLLIIDLGKYEVNR